MEAFLTVGQLAQEADCPIWKAQYILRSRDIKPLARAGNMRLFAFGVVEVLRSELQQIEKKKRAS